MRKLIVCLLAVATVWSSATLGEAALTISLHSANQGIGSFTFTFDGSTIRINETWTGSGPGYLQIDGLGVGNWAIEKTIVNNSGTAWTRLANELLDPAGDSNDSRDPQPYPSHVPAGFSTSNDFDGISFSTTSISSTVWSNYVLDINTDARDYLDFYNGTLANGATGVMRYRIYDNGPNQPFLLSQRPNASSGVIPEPSAAVCWMLLVGTVVTLRYNKKGSRLVDYVRATGNR